MGAYEIEFIPRAMKQFLDLEHVAQTRLQTKIDALSTDPRPHGCTKLTDEKNAFRLRVGDYRVIYAVDDEQEIITVTRVAHRSSAYRP